MRREKVDWLETIADRVKRGLDIHGNRYNPNVMSEGQNDFSEEPEKESEYINYERNRQNNKTVSRENREVRENN